jgi:hypothetical protein
LRAQLQAVGLPLSLANGVIAKSVPVEKGMENSATALAWDIVLLNG